MIVTSNCTMHNESNVMRILHVECVHHSYLVSVTETNNNTCKCPKIHTHDVIQFQGSVSIDSTFTATHSSINIHNKETLEQ